MAPSGDQPNVTDLPTGVAAERRIIHGPPNVIGDGRCDLVALISAKNDERVRRGLPGHVAIEIDAELLREGSPQDVGGALIDRLLAAGW
jgi:hypothetical protein